MANSDRIPVSIYQIKLSRFPDHTFDEIIGTIIETERATGSDFQLQPLAPSFNPRFPVHIFHAAKSQYPSWNRFISSVLAADAPLRTRRNTTQSFLCFVDCVDELFVISGGQGNFVVQPYIEDEFGLEIITRLIDKDSKVIKSLQDRGLTGVVLGQTRFYRGDQRFSDEDQFGKIFKLVQAELNQRLLTRELAFNAADLRNADVGCLAKSAFELKKAISFDTMLRLMGRFCEILQQPKKFSLNKVLLISHRGDANRTLREDLDRQFIAVLYRHCRANEIPDFDFCHPQFEPYLTASEYRLEFTTTESVSANNPFTLKQILDELRTNDRLDLTDEYHVKQVLINYEVVSLDAESRQQTRGTLLDHLHGEIRFRNESYFRIDKEWYRIDPAFIDDLNFECKQMLTEAWDDTSIRERFNINRREREFNEQFIGQSNTLVFDTITPENVEACDILKWNENFIYVIHVKKGFNTSMRDLAAQISISAKRIRADKHSNGRYLESLQAQTRNGSRSRDLFLQRLANQVFPADGLVRLFESKRDKEIVFCLAVVDEALEERSIKDNIENFNSNIAKFALIELNREIRNMGFDFRVIQLARDSPSARG